MRLPSLSSAFRKPWQINASTFGWKLTKNVKMCSTCRVHTALGKKDSELSAFSEGTLNLRMATAWPESRFWQALY
jgi:hypothetical protein